MPELVLFHRRKVAPEIVHKLRKWTAGHKDFTVSSAYRSPAVNRAVGGAPNSYHLRGRAVDIVGSKAILDHLQQTAKAHGAVEVLRESDHLHVAF